MKRAIIIGVAGAMLLALGACTSMDVTLENDGDGATVSVIAKAPSMIVSLETLIAEANQATASACQQVPQPTSPPLQKLLDLSKIKELVGDVKGIAEDTKAAADAMRGWFPENSYTVSRACVEGINISANGD